MKKGSTNLYLLGEEMISPPVASPAFSPAVTPGGDGGKKKTKKNLLAPGDKGSDIVAPAVVAGKIVRFYLSSFWEKFILILFYPHDFPVMCSDEIPEFSSRINEFREVDCEIVGVSTDSHFAHLAYVKAQAKNGGLGGRCSFPLVSDKTMAISKKYKMVHASGKFCYRGTVLLDPEGKVAHVSYNDFNEARRVDQLLRIVMAHRTLIGLGDSGKVCYIPEGWQRGDHILEERNLLDRKQEKKRRSLSKTQTSVRLLVAEDDSKKMKERLKV